MTPLGAMNSSAWLVESRIGRHVLKISDPRDIPGLRAAVCLAERGFETGPPERIRRRGGRLIALLRYVEGSQLVDADARRIGSTLGLMHRALRDIRPSMLADRWPWTWLNLNQIRDADLRSAATDAVRRATAVAPTTTHGILHGDPAPEAFIGRGARTALIDWGASLHGPLLYDVASAVMYAGTDVLGGYADTKPLTADELEHVPAFQAFRWAVQAWYFSMRIARNDLTGIGGPEDNEIGLADARAGLLG